MASLVEEIKQANKKPSLIDEIKSANKPKTLLEEIRDANLRPEPRMEEGADSTTGFPAPTVPLTTAPAPSSPLLELGPFPQDKVRDELPASLVPGTFPLDLSLAETMWKEVNQDNPPTWWKRTWDWTRQDPLDPMLLEEDAPMHDAIMRTAQIGLAGLEWMVKPGFAVSTGIHRGITTTHPAGWVTKKELPPRLKVAMMKKKPLLWSRHTEVKAAVMETFWDNFKAGAADGWNGVDRKNPMDSVYLTALGPDADAKFNAFLERHPKVKLAKDITDFGIELGVGVVVEAACWRAASAAAVRILPKVPKGEKIIGMFGSLSNAQMRRGFKKAVQDKMDDMIVGQDMLRILDIGPGEISHRHIETMEQLVDALGPRVARQIQWPGIPTEKSIRELYKLYDVKLGIPRRIKAGDLFVPPAGEYIPKSRKILLAKKAMKAGGDIRKYPFKSYSLGELSLHELAHHIWFTKLDDAQRKMFSSLYKGDDLAQEGFANIFAAVNMTKVSDIDKPFLDMFTKVMKSGGMERDFQRNLYKVFSEAIGKVDDATMVALTHGYINKLGQLKIVSREQVKKLVKLHSFGETDDFTKLTLPQLMAVRNDIDTAVTAPAKFHAALSAAGGIGGMPPMEVFRHLGLEDAFGRMSDYFYLEHIAVMNRRRWMYKAKRAYKKTFGNKWDDAANEAAARLADGGPGAVLPKELLESLTDDQLGYIRRMVDEDKLLHWEPFADIAETRGIITSDPAKIAQGAVPRKEYYYHHRKKVIDAIRERAAKETALGKKAILPPDYRVDKIMRDKIPANVDAIEFMIRKKTGIDGVRLDWDRLTDISYREEARKLFFEPGMKEMDITIDMIPDFANREMAKTITAKWARMARGMPTPMDEKLNKFVQAGVSAATLGKVKPSDRAWERFATSMVRLARLGTLTGNARTSVRNLFQSQLTINTIGNESTLWGIQSMLHPWGRELLDTSQVMIHRKVLAEFDITTKRGWDKLAMLGIGATDRYINCAGAYNGAIHRVFKDSPKHMDELIEYAAKKGIARGKLGDAQFGPMVAQAMKDGLFGDVARMAHKNLAATQWLYEPWNLPLHMHGATGRFAWMYTSWASYFYSVHLPQLKRTMTTGVNVLGMPASKAQRMAMFTFTAKSAAIYYLGQEMGIDLGHMLITGPLPQGRLLDQSMPVPISPNVNAFTALGATAIGFFRNDDRLLDSGLRAIENSLPAYIPGGISEKRLLDVILEREPPAALLFKLKKEEKSAWSGREPGAPSGPSVPTP